MDFIFDFFFFSVLVTRIATYKELDHDFEKHAGLLTLVRHLFLIAVFQVDIFHEYLKGKKFGGNLYFARNLFYFVIYYETKITINN